MSTFDGIARLALRDKRLPEPAERKRIRESTGTTQEELAAEIGVHPLTISKWERGVEEPTGARLVRYQAFLSLATTKGGGMSEEQMLGIPADGLCLNGIEGVVTAAEFKTALLDLSNGPREFTLAEEKVQKVYAGVQGRGQNEWHSIYRALCHRGFCDTTGAQEEWSNEGTHKLPGGYEMPKGNRVVKVTETFEITSAGQEVLEALRAA